MSITRRAWLSAMVAACLPAARAEEGFITVSTGNTPLDRRALQVLSHEAFKRLGLQFRLVDQPSERSLASANLGEVDGEGLRVAGLEARFPNLIQVPERYIGISFVAFARDASIRLQGWESLRPFSVAHITGWKLFETNATNARLVTKVDRPEQLFLMLDSGRVDLALYTLADGVALARKLGLPSIAPLGPSLQDVDMFLYLNRRHQALVPKLARTLRDMKADGSYNRLLANLDAQ